MYIGSHIIFSFKTKIDTVILVIRESKLTHWQVGDWILTKNIMIRICITYLNIVHNWLLALPNS